LFGPLLVHLSTLHYTFFLHFVGTLWYTLVHFSYTLLVHSPTLWYTCLHFTTLCWVHFPTLDSISLRSFPTLFWYTLVHLSTLYHALLLHFSYTVWIHFSTLAWTSLHFFPTLFLYTFLHFPTLVGHTFLSLAYLPTYLHLPCATPPAQYGLMDYKSITSRLEICGHEFNSSSCVSFCQNTINFLTLLHFGYTFLLVLHLN
jgi:hypothetical protein